MANYFDALLSAGEKSPVATLGRYIELLRENGLNLGMPMARMIDRQNRVYELRVGNHRVAYAEVAAEVVLLNAWRKQTQRLDQREASVAGRRLEGLRRRENHGNA